MVKTHPPFLMVGKFFTPTQCQELIKHAYTVGWKESTVLGGKTDGIRHSDVVFISGETYQNHWVRNLITTRSAAISDLMGIACAPEHIESVQISMYNEGGYYDWHTDHAAGGHYDLGHPGFDRKISLVVALDESVDGGLELENVGMIRLNPGDAIVFSALSRHRAPTQNEGVRHSMAIWIPGPRWT